MSGPLVNRVSFLFSIAAFIGVLIFSTHAFAQYKSSGHISRSGGHSHGVYGGVKQNRSYNAQIRSTGYVRKNHGLRLNTQPYSSALRSGVRIGNSGYKNRGYGNRNLRTVNRIKNNYRYNSNRIQRVKQKRGYKNQGYGVTADPNYNRNVRRTNQYNSDSDLYYIDQSGVNVISSNNPNNYGYYDNNGGYYAEGIDNEVVVIKGETGSPPCPKGLNCGYRLYEDGTGPRIISLGASTEGLPPQDGLSGGPKIIQLGK